MKYEIILGIILVSVVAGAFALNQSYLDTVTTTDINETDTTTETTTEQTTTTDTTVNYTLSQQEIDSILFMREEEKLARDVYLTLYDMYGLQIFQNIARSEQNHMDAVLTLIEKYNLTDPVIDEVGVFTNETLQELYNQLIEQGSQSLTDAILVGALIEEKDIIDINNLINATDNPDIIQVFSNLVNGSAHHLKAFSNEYEQITGEPYQPQLLTPEQYEATISSVVMGPANAHGPAWGQG